MRCFLGIGLPELARDAVERIQEHLRSGRHVDPDNLHLTLAFLDDQDVQTLEALNEECTALSLPAFDLRLAGLETFGREDRPRAVVLRAEGGPELKALRDWCRGAARRAGIDLPRERFRPHVTLARFRRDTEARDLDRLGRFLQSHGDTALAPFRVGAVTLFRSHLGPDGAEYEALADYPLRPVPAGVEGASAP